MAKCPFLSVQGDFFFIYLFFNLTRPVGKFCSQSSALCSYQKPAVQPGVISSLLTGGPEFETAGVLQLGAEWCWQNCLKKFAEFLPTLC